MAFCGVVKRCVVTMECVVVHTVCGGVLWLWGKTVCSGRRVCSGVLWLCGRTVCSSRGVCGCVLFVCVKGVCGCGGLLYVLVSVLRLSWVV